MEILGYLASLIMGLTIGLLGGGGSILTVPILVYLFSIRATDATTSSLFIVGSTAFVTSLQYRLRGEADWKVGVSFALPSLIGIYLARNVVLPSIPEVMLTSFGFTLAKDTLILGAFGALMIAASISMIRKKSPSPAGGKKHPVALVGLQGVVVGFVTGFVGAGGGFLILPALVNVLKLPMRVAIGTSLFIIAINSLFGFSVSALAGPVGVAWSLQLTILAIALIGSFIGAKLSGGVDERKLKRGFGWFVLVIGIVIIVERFNV